MSDFAPIALFVYNRPKHTQITLKALQENKNAQNHHLFIFADAPKSPKDIPVVNAVKQLIQQVSGFKSVTVFEQPQNLGLAKSIISGVSRLVKEYGRVIVFEDDLQSSPYTLNFFNEALSRYQNDKKVMHISAYMYPLKAKNQLLDAFFYRVVHSWGWATWDRAWKNFEPDIDVLLPQFDEQKIKAFSVDGTMNFWKQMLDFKAGKNNSWAIRWYASVFLQGGITLNPVQSLIHNIGHDGSGIHSNPEEMYATEIYQHELKNYPSLIEEDAEMYAHVKHFLANRKGSLWQRAVRYLKKKIS